MNDELRAGVLQRLIRVFGDVDIGEALVRAVSEAYQDSGTDYKSDLEYAARRWVKRCLDDANMRA